MRKIVQMAAFGQGSGSVYALCHHGTLWFLKQWVGDEDEVPREGADRLQRMWIRMPDIPQRD